MTKPVLSILLAVVAMAAGSSNASADQTLTITFKKRVAGDQTVGRCVAQMTGRDKKRNSGDTNSDPGPSRGELIKWKLVAGNCVNFDAGKVSLLFASDLFPSRTLRGDSSTMEINAKTTTDANQANNNTAHRYFILYDNLDAGDPELDVNGDCCLKGKGRGKPPEPETKKK